MAFFVVFIVMLLLLYVIIWLPFVNGLTNDILHTKKMLMLIPLELLLNMKSVAKRLNDHLKLSGKKR